MPRPKKSVREFKDCGCHMDDDYKRSPNSVLEANQKMRAERFDKLNHENDRNTKRRAERRKDKSEFDSDLGGPI